MSDKFVQHLERASAVVRTWPDWKQKLLGGTAMPNDLSKDERERLQETCSVDWMAQRISDLESERDRLAGEQEANRHYVTKCAIELLEAGCKGPGTLEGIQQLREIIRQQATRIEELQHYEAKYREIVERCRATPERCFCGVHQSEAFNKES